MSVGILDTKHCLKITNSNECRFEQVCLNYGGSIIDASVKAVVAALKNVRVPKVELVILLNNFTLEIWRTKAVGNFSNRLTNYYHLI